MSFICKAELTVVCVMCSVQWHFGFNGSGSTVVLVSLRLVFFSYISLRVSSASKAQPIPIISCSTRALELSM